MISQFPLADHSKFEKIQENIHIMSSLFELCSRQEEDKVLELLTPEDTNICNVHGVTLLMYALDYGLNRVTRWLLNQPDLDYLKKMPNGQSALLSLIESIRFIDQDIVKKMCELPGIFNNLSDCESRALGALMQDFKKLDAFVA